jgi:hypothetical protein
MADHINNPERPERYEETNDPNLPPNVMINKTTRNGAFWSYMGPVIVLFVVFAIAMLYWMNNDNPRRPSDDGTAIGTSGDTGGSTSGGTQRPEGGFQPDPKPGNTSEEVEHRGGDGR